MKSRKGFTLVELLVSLAIGGIVAAFMFSTLTRQHRFYGSASAIIDTRAQLRDAADILVTDIRSAAIELGVPAMRDSAIEMFTLVASSIVCTAESGQSFGLPPLELASGTSLTSMLVQPDTGDLALLYTIPTGSPDSGSWEVRSVTSFATRSVATACPPSSRFTTAADGSSGNLAFAVLIASPAPDSVRIGAPINFVRRSRYSLYRSSDNRWYLGHRRCKAIGPSACATVQPVSGPYDPYPGGKPGLSFRYFDGTGAELSPVSDGTALARVDIVVRAKNPAGNTLAGDASATWADSTIVSVATRNRWR